MTLRDLALYFLRLGTTGFGGPVALVGYMQRDLVDERGWFTAREYRDGLALSQLAPGPLAAQLAMYLGWARGGAWGAAVVGLAFVLPSFLMVVAIAVGYLHFGGLPWMQGAFYGIGAAVLAIVARSAAKLTRLTLGTDRLLWGLAAVAATVTAWTESEVGWVFLGAGVAALLIRTRAVVRAPALALALLPGLTTGLGGQPAAPGTLARIAVFFTEAGAFVFGSGLAIVPFLHAGVVRELHWLDERQFLDAVAVAMITPGPVVITVGFIGYLVAGPAGALVAALATFLPCYVFTVVPAPHFQRLSASRGVRAFVDGVTAAATGAIAGAVFVLGRRALVDLVTVGVASAALLVLVVVRKVPEPALIAAAGVAGILLQAPAAPGRTTRVVFVCEHGSAKSLVASSVFERMARARGVRVEALSRGTAPDPSVPPAVVEALRGEGVDVASFRPQRLTDADAPTGTRVIAIGVPRDALPAGLRTRAELWTDVPPFSEGYPRSRAVLATHLDALLRQLEEEGRGRR